MSTLFPFQERLVEQHLKARYSIDHSVMGAGKTKIALHAAKRAGLRTIVFGPAFLESNWKYEAKLEGVEITYYKYSMVKNVDRNKLSNEAFWIVDECHMLKTPKAQRTMAFYGLLVNVQPKYFLGLTGTPIKNRVPDIWTLLGFCSKCPEPTNGKRLEGELRKFFSFSSYFCYANQFEIYGRVVTKFEGIQPEKIGELKSLLAGKFFAAKAEEALRDLPELIRKPVILDLKNPPVGYAEAFEEFLLGGKIDIAAKTRSALFKAKATAEYVKSLAEEVDTPILVFTDHRASAMEIKLHIPKLNVAVCTGETPPCFRATLVDKFQAGKIDVLIATIGSLSVGVTLTAATNVVFNDLSWVPADNDQAEKRIHRIGQSSRCIAHYIFSSHVDKHIYEMLRSKKSAIASAIGE